MSAGERIRIEDLGGKFSDAVKANSKSGTAGIFVDMSTDRFRPDRIDLAEERPESLPSEAGIPGMGEVRVRWFLKGKGQFGVRWRGEKALDARVRTQIPE